MGTNAAKKKKNTEFHRDFLNECQGVVDPGETVMNGFFTTAGVVQESTVFCRGGGG